MKKFLICLLLTAAGGCSLMPSAETGFAEGNCPPISIPRETARLYQNNGRFDEFQVNLVGYEGYCYVNPADNRRYAEITPIFKVRRLEDSSVTSLDADFYVKTSINAEDYLGIRKFSQPLDIPRSVKERTVKGRTTRTRIAEPPYEGFAIMLGMSLTEAEKAKAGKMFDIDYRYLSAAELAAQNEPETETVYLEVGPDEEVVYSEAEAKPVVVKKGQLKSPCQD